MAGKSAAPGLYYYLYQKTPGKQQRKNLGKESDRLYNINRIWIFLISDWLFYLSANT
jgi:hypothetical protein